MRALWLIPILLSLTAPVTRARAAGRPVLDLPVRYSGLPRVAPAYAGDVLEIQLAPGAAAAARLTGQAAARRRSLGVPGLDRIAQDLGGVWFETEFRGEVPPAVGSRLPDFTSFYIAHLPRGLQLEDALARFRASAEVSSASPIAILPVARVPIDSLWSDAYWFSQIHAPEAWDVTIGDSSIVVAVLDTGVLPYHPDLGGTVAGLPGQIWTNWAEQGGLPGVDDDDNTIVGCPGFVDDVHGWDFVSLGSSGEARPGEDWQDADNDPNDFASHGTGVAGLVGALTNNVIGVSGTAWNVRIMPLRMGWSWSDPIDGDAPQGDGEVRMDFAACAIRYATRMGAHVINCSWTNRNELGLDAAVNEAVRNGVAVVVAAGNDPRLPNYLMSRRDVISVAATDAQDKIAGFSVTGPDVDLAAPGVGITTTWLKPWAASSDSVVLRQPDYMTNLDGTSFSAPLVSGAIALLQARQRARGLRLLHPMGALLRLWETTDDISAQNPTLIGQYGSGRLNLQRALTETTGSTATGMGGWTEGAAMVLGGGFKRGFVPNPAGGPPRIAFVTTNQRLMILDGATQDTVAQVDLPDPAAGGLAAADLGGGRGVGLFVGTLAGWVAGFRPSGSRLPGWPRAGGGFAMSGGPALGDLDGDGETEVVCGAEDGTLWAWHGDGTQVAGFPRAIAPGSQLLPVALSDLDGLPGAEIVATAADGTVAAVRWDGKLLPGWPFGLGGPPSATSAPAVAGRGAAREPVIVIAADNQLHALSRAGQELAGFPAALVGSVSQGLDVALGDLDLDGEDEAVVATFNGIEARKLTGASLASWPKNLTPDISGSPVLGHLAGGGGPEVLVLRGFSLLGLTSQAEPLAAFPKPGGAGRFPTLADLDGDGTTEVIAGTGPGQIFYIYDAGPSSFAAASQPWPTARANFARTGSRLYDGSPQPPPPPSGLALTILGHPSRLPVSFRWSAAPEAVGSPQVIRIYDVMGRRRAQLSLGTGAGGFALWDGRDEDGDRVGAGLYFVRFSSGAAHLDERLVVIP